MFINKLPNWSIAYPYPIAHGTVDKRRSLKNRAKYKRRSQKNRAKKNIGEPEKKREKGEIIYVPIPAKLLPAKL